MRRTQVLAILGLTASSAGIATAVWAYFTSSGSGQSAASVGTLAPPTGLTTTVPNPTVRTVHLAWTAPASPDSSALSGYTVLRWSGSSSTPACGTGSTPLAGTAISCDDTSVASGTYTYTVTADWKSWTATSSHSSSITMPASALDHFTVAPSTSTPTAGVPLTLTLTAIDQYGATDSAYAGSQCLALSGPATSPSPSSQSPAYPAGGSGCAHSLVSFSAGVGSAAATLYDAQSVTLTVTDVPTSKTGSAALTVAAAGIDHFALGPSTTTPTAGTAFTTTLVAQDLYDNTAVSYTGAKTITWSGLSTSPAPASTAPSYPASAVSFSSGSATTTLSATAYASGANTLVATDASASKTGSAALTVAAAGIDHFALGPSTTTPTAGTAFTTTLVAQDLYDNTAVSYTGAKTITWSGLSTSPAPASTAPSYPASAVSFSSGSATTTLSATAYASGANTLVATDASASKTGSAALTVAAAGIDHFTLGPSTTTPTAGTAFTTTLVAQDLYDNTAVSYTGAKTITWSGLSTSPAPASTAPSYPASAVSFSSGSATTTLSATAYASGANTLVATDASASKTGSAALTVAAAGIDHFALGPSTTTPTAGTAFTTTLVAQDLYDNTAVSYTGAKTITWSGLSTSPAPASTAPSYPASAVSFSSGSATTTLSATAYASGANTLVATDASASKTGSAALTVSPAAAHQLLVPTPSTQTAGVSFSLTLTAVDLYDNVATSYTGSKTLAWSGPASAPNGTAPLYPSNPVSFSSGAATTSVTLYKAESPALTVSDGTNSGTSGAFTVKPAASAKVVVTTQPTNTNGGAVITPSPAVSVEDAYSNVVTTDTSNVTMAIGTNPVGGTLSGTATVAASSGVATFSGLSINKAGTGYTLDATDASLTSGTSSTFNITVGPVSKLAFTTQPSGATSATGVFPIQPVVTAEDAGGNTVTSYATSITLAMGTNPTSTSLTCTTNPVAPSSGVASFSGCHLGATGNGYTLKATSGVLTSATSSTFNVTGSATKLAFTTQPGGGAAATAWATQPVVSVEDINGNVVTAYPASSVPLTITAGTGANGATLTCTQTSNTATTSYGLATFSGCRINLASTTYTLTATSSGLTSAASSTFTITAGPASQLLFVQQPSGCTAATACSTQPAVGAYDAQGNLATAYTGAVTVAITAGTGTSGATLSCTANPINVGGQGFPGYGGWSGCAISTGGTGYTLTATASGLTSATSSSFNVAAFVQSLTLNNKTGGTAGTAEAGDTIVITYPNALTPGTLCSGWSGSTTLTHVTVSFAAGSGHGANTINDKITGMTDSTDCNSGTGFNSTGGAGIGSIDMGVKGGFFSGTGSFTGSTAVWNSSTNTLTITLGTLSGTVLTEGSTETAVYTPDASLSMPGTISSANSILF